MFLTFIYISQAFNFDDCILHNLVLESTIILYLRGEKLINCFWAHSLFSLLFLYHFHINIQVGTKRIPWIFGHVYKFDDSDRLIIDRKKQCISMMIISFEWVEKSEWILSLIDEIEPKNDWATSIRHDKFYHQCQHYF